jgi:hypothetical protein
MDEISDQERILAESQAYIEDSVSYWFANGEKKKIISLARMAEKWRRKPVITDEMKLKAIQKNINGIKLINKRMEDIDTDALKDELSNTLNKFEDVYAKISAQLGGVEVKPIDNK